MIRWLAALLWLIAAACILAAPARADINVEVPAPGTCPYPGVSDQGMAAALVATFWWSCDFPVEENGSIWHCYYYGAAGQGNLGFSMMVQVGMSGPVGGMKGGCHYVCPDGPHKGQRSAWPNPPGAWKYPLKPNVCVPLAVQPIDAAPAPDVPPATPPDPFPVPPPEAGLTPAVTNPDNPNPDATVNPQ
jgi:hypothetical protein